MENDNKKVSLDGLLKARQDAVALGHIYDLQVINQLIAEHAKKHRLDYYSL